MAMRTFSTTTRNHLLALFVVACMLLMVSPAAAGAAFARRGSLSKKTTVASATASPNKMMDGVRLSYLPEVPAFVGQDKTSTVRDASSRRTVARVVKKQRPAGFQLEASL